LRKAFPRYHFANLRLGLVGLAKGGNMYIRRFACAALVMCALAFSQTTSSRISGTITDPQGAAVPGAAVTILNPVTGQSFTTTSNVQGDFVVPSVPAATYRITVTAK